MGTNFYRRGHSGLDKFADHIGKRSAAGLYCWHCNLTLCKGGNDAVHMGKSQWHEACQRCGRLPVKDSISSGAAARELGFDKSPFSKKKDVASCSSFSWAMNPGDAWGLLVAGKCPCCDQLFQEQDKVIEDEYGDLYTLEEFKQMLEECPIQYTHSVGKDFS